MTEWNTELYRERSSLQQTMAAGVLQDRNRSVEAVLPSGGNSAIGFRLNLQ
jgi:hypothetical protein